MNDTSSLARQSNTNVKVLELSFQPSQHQIIKHPISGEQEEASL